MRIAIVVGQSPPKWLGGTEIATYNIARHLAKRGHEVHVITSLDDGLPGYSMEQGFHVHRIGLLRVRFLGIIMFWLRRVLKVRRLGPDIVHCQSIMMGVVGFLGKKLLHKPYVVWGRGADIYMPWLFKTPILRLVLKNADGVIALTEDMKKEMQKTRAGGISVIANGLDLERFAALRREEMRGKLQTKPDQRLIVFAGGFRPVKGVTYLIEAMNVVREKHRSAMLMLIGKGPEEDTLRHLAERLDLGNCVRFVGQVPNDAVPQYLAAADVLVLPSLSEGFPNVVLEAMAAGLPVVASRVGGLPEIIEEGHNGFLVEPKSPEQIAEKVLLLLGDDELRKRISENNREKAQGYSWERVVDRLEEVYRGVAPGGG